MNLGLHANYVQRNPKAVAAHVSGARFLVVVAGRRGGKTTFAPEEGAARIYRDDLPGALARPYNPGNARRGTAEWWRRKPRLHYWAVAPEYDLIDEMKRCFGQAIPAELIEHQNTADNAWWLKPDILLEFKSAKNPDKLVSVGLNGLFLEEAPLLHPEAWEGRLRPCLSDKGGWCIVTGTPKGRNWFWDEFVVKSLEGAPGYSFHTWHTIDNAANVPGLAAEVEHARATLSPEYFAREYEASFDAFHGQVFPGWDDDRFSLAELPHGLQFRKIVGGADWGFSNPGCLGVVGFGELGAYRIDEVYKKSELVEDFWAPEALRLMGEHGFREWICDPAEPDNLMRFSKAGRPLGIIVSGHRNYGSGKFDEHARSVLSGIRLMASAIHQGRMWCLRDTCRDFRREMQSYVWDQAGDGAWLERPAAHQADHAIATQRYAMTSDGRVALRGI